MQAEKVHTINPITQRLNQPTHEGKEQMRSLLALGLMVAAEATSADEISYIDSCGASSTVNNEMLLVTADIQATDPQGNDNPCIAISHEHVTLDCQGHTLVAPSPPFTTLPWGIAVFDTPYDVTLRNCKLEGWWMSIYYEGQYGLIESIEIIDGGFGIVLGGADGNEVHHNKVIGGLSWDGIVLSGSEGNVVHHNTVNQKPFGSGIALLRSSSNDVFSNVANKNGRGIALQDQADNNNIFDNTTNLNRRTGLSFYDSSENNVVGNTSNKNDVGIEEFTEQEDGLENLYKDNICKNNQTVDSNVDDACR
jgi:parallel beta-helix repeat protein